LTFCSGTIASHPYIDQHVTDLTVELGRPEAYKSAVPPPITVEDPKPTPLPASVPVHRSDPVSSFPKTLALVAFCDVEKVPVTGS